MHSARNAMLQSDGHMLAALADDAASSSSPSSTSTPSPRLSDAFSVASSATNEATLEDIAALMTTSRSAAAAAASSAKEAKPKLTVSASGRFQDQFYHAQEASRAMGIFKNRAIVKQTTEGQRSDAAVKRKKSINVNGRDVEQFSDADIVYAGYLVKQGSFWKTWRRRYFILRRDVNVLAYYTSQDNLVKLGEIAIDATTRVEPPSAAATTAFPGRFIVEHHGRKLVLVAEDGKRSAETWANIITRCIATRAAEAEAAAVTALMGSSRGSSERESMRSSLMQLRLSTNGSQLTPQEDGVKKPVRVASSANGGAAPATATNPAASAAEPIKRTDGQKSIKKGLVPVNPQQQQQPHGNAARGNVTMLNPVTGKENTAANSAPTKIKRHSTDSVAIQAAADEAVAQRGSLGFNDTARDRIVHNARLKSIDSANDSARKLLDGKGKAPVRANSTESPVANAAAKGPQGAPAPRRLFRSYSAGSVLSMRSTGFDQVRSDHDDCGLLSMHMSSRGSYPDPNSNKHLRVERESRKGADPDNGSESRARNLSLPSLRPVASVELSVSVGCRGTQDVSDMIVVLSAIAPSVNRGEAKELARTEVQGALALRACGGDFFARDFSALLSVPISASARNLMLQFELFSVTNLSSENLGAQQSLGFVRIPHVDLLFSGDSTLVLECLRARLSPSKQKHFLVLDRIRPSESLNLGHSYTYAKRHFVADIVPVGASSTDMVTWITTSTTTATEKAGNRSSFETVATSPVGSSLESSRSSLSYAGMIRGTLESAEATQVFISEELSSSYCSISVAAKYMALLQQRNRRRMHDAKLLINDIEQKYENMPSSPNSRTEAGDIINLHSEMIRDAEARVEYYRKLYESYVECEDYYDVLLAMLEEGKEPGITGSLKRSVQKKDKRTEFMPTNLNCHVVRARRVALSSASAAMSTKDPGTRERSLIGGAKGDEMVYAVVTHGCPAAHCLGFKDGGLRRMQAALAQSKEDDPRLRERMEQRQDVVHCQILSIASASFLTVIGLAANQSARHQERLRLMCETGFLLNMESLLSTIKNEKGMIEDMYEGVQWLNTNVSFQVVQSMENSPKLKCAKCVAITSSEKREVTATFALPPDVFATLPQVLQHGHALKVHAVMFTQGINEMQSVANTVLDTSLQDEINLESSTRLVRYFQVYKTHVLAMQPPNQDRIDDLADLEIELQILAGKLNQSRKSHVQKKNVNILIESSDLCRRLGAGRTTCCKSGKDRTAMSVTLECSRLLVDKFHVRQGVHLTNAMRERGVRRVNVLANTGKNKFAFNSFQLKYLPDCYRPPVLSADSSVQS